MRSSYMSQVLEPSPQGVLRVVTFRFLVGRRTGPLTLRSLLLARSRSSVQTFSRDWTLREVRVMRYNAGSVGASFGLGKTGWTYDAVGLGGLTDVLVSLVVRHVDGDGWV